MNISICEISNHVGFLRILMDSVKIFFGRGKKCSKCSDIRSLEIGGSVHRDLDFGNPG